MTLALAGFLLAQRTAARPNRAPPRLGPRTAAPGRVLGCSSPGSPRPSGCSPRGGGGGDSGGCAGRYTVCMRAILRPGAACTPRSACPYSCSSPFPGTGLRHAACPISCSSSSCTSTLTRYLTPSADREEAWWYLRCRVSARQHSVDAVGGARDAPRLAARRRERRVQSHAVPLDLGVVRLRVFFAVRLQTHPLHFAGDAGPCVADRLVACGRSAARRAIRGAVDGSRWRSGWRCSVSSGRGSFRRPIVGVYFVSLVKPLAQDCSTARRIGVLCVIAAPSRYHAFGRVSRGWLVSIRIAADAGRRGGDSCLLGV